MLHVVAKLLNLYLPYKNHYKTFSDGSISSRTFNTNVKLLNCNVICLCLQQGIDAMHIDPRHTLVNLQLLIEKLLQDGKRLEFCVPNLWDLSSMENTLDLQDITDEDMKDIDDYSSLDWHINFDADWETVGETMGSYTPSIPIYPSAATQSSIFAQPTELVSSAVGWFTRGWW